MHVLEEVQSSACFWWGFRFPASVDSLWKSLRDHQKRSSDVVIFSCQLSFGCHCLVTAWMRGVLPALAPWMNRWKLTWSDSRCCCCFTKAPLAFPLFSSPSRIPQCVCASTIQEVASRLHHHVVKEYVGQLMKKSYSCKNRKHEKAAAKISKQMDALKDLFREMVTNLTTSLQTSNPRTVYALPVKQLELR